MLNEQQSVTLASTGIAGLDEVMVGGLVRELTASAYIGTSGALNANANGPHA